MKEVEIYAAGLFYLSLCASSDIEVNQIELQANLEYPTGVSPWSIADENFRDGSKNPHQCEKDESRLHYLLSC